MKKTHTITWNGQISEDREISPNQFSYERAVELCAFANKHFRKVRHNVVRVKKDTRYRVVGVEED